MNSQENTKVKRKGGESASVFEEATKKKETDGGINKYIAMTEKPVCLCVCKRQRKHNLNFKSISPKKKTNRAEVMFILHHSAKVQ